MRPVSRRDSSKSLITASVISLFGDLDRGALAITATRRLARQVEQRYADWKFKQGVVAWPAPRICTYHDWLVDLWRAVAAHDQSAPRLLSDDQELLLWEQVIRSNAATLNAQMLFQLSGTARVARQSWQRLNEWGLELPRMREYRGVDAEAFLNWAKDFHDALQDRRWLTSAQLPEHLRDRSGAWLERVPRLIWWMGFDTWPVAQGKIFNLLQSFGARQHRFENSGTKETGTETCVVECFDPGEQWMHIARWARSRLAVDNGASLGVVCPDLHGSRDDIEEILEDVLHPDLGWDPDAPRSYHLSLGRPLSDYPLTRAALDLLHWSERRVRFELVSKTLRSPFLNVGDLDARIDMELHLRRHRQETFSLGYLIDVSARREGLSQLNESMVRAQATQWPEHSDPATWAGLFSDWLRIFGWPGERTPDSHEYQTINAWYETLSRFASLGSVQEQWPRSDALKKIVSMCSARILQFHDDQAPLQVMGASESTGIWFDEIWLADMNDAVWPPSPQPDPFIPVYLQKECGIPEASALSTLEHARVRSTNWLRSAEQVHISFVARDADAPRSLSPLFAGKLLPGASNQDGFPGRAQQIAIAGPALEAVPEHRGPALKGELRRGGVSVVADQAKCPFRAFSHHRLNARDLPEVTPGLDARDRGILVHNALSRLWNRLRTLKALKSMSEVEIRKVVCECVEKAVDRVFSDSSFQRRLLELEQRRLQDLLLEWLQLEGQRGPFEVAGTELEARVELGGMEFVLRMDRMDQLPDGRVVIIDYKTGVLPRLADWGDPRPEDPQLPMYALSVDRKLAALVLAGVGRGQCQMRGLGEDNTGIPSLLSPSVKLDSSNMAQLKKSWAGVLGRLVDEYRQGDAWVDPKNSHVCKQCDVMPLCRIFERGGLASDQR